MCDDEQISGLCENPRARNHGLACVSKWHPLSFVASLLLWQIERWSFFCRPPRQRSRCFGFFFALPPPLALCFVFGVPHQTRLVLEERLTHHLLSLDACPSDVILLPPHRIHISLFIYLFKSILTETKRLAKARHCLSQRRRSVAVTTCVQTAT